MPERLARKHPSALRCELQPVSIVNRRLGNGCGEAFWLEARRERPGQIVVFHGYGQSRHEALGLGVSLAQHGWTVLVPDLPGHGDHPGLLASAQIWQLAHACLRILEPDRPIHTIGFSLGGRVALELPAQSRIAVSPPGSAQFVGTHSELLGELRPHLVRESRRLAGLTEILGQLGLAFRPGPPALIVSGQHDLVAVREWVAGLEQVPGVTCKVIRGATHHAAWWAPQTRTWVLEWLEKRHEESSR